MPDGVQGPPLVPEHPGPFQGNAAAPCRGCPQQTTKGV